MNAVKQKHFDCFNVSKSQKAYQKQGKQRIKTTITTDCAVYNETNEEVDKVENEENAETEQDYGKENENDLGTKIELMELRKFWEKFLT